MIGVSRHVLGAVVLKNCNISLTHDVLTILMSGVMAVMNAKHFDSSIPGILSPAFYLTKKRPAPIEYFQKLGRCKSRSLIDFFKGMETNKQRRN